MKGLFLILESKWYDFYNYVWWFEMRDLFLSLKIRRGERRVRIAREMSEISIYFGWLSANIVCLRTNKDKRMMREKDIFFKRDFYVNMK